MRRAAIFVLSDVRSGSTLVDQCLGGHPDVVSLGEVHWLTAYLAQDRRLYNPEHPLVCTCGAPVRECPFWNEVEKALGFPLATLQLRQQLKRRRGRRGFMPTMIDLPFQTLRANPGLYRFSLVRRQFGGRSVAQDCIRLYDAVATATGRPYCVDSSKSPFRFRDVIEADPHKTLAINLSRDYRAVVHSKMKRGMSLRTAALGWRRRMQQIRVLTADVPQSQVLSLSYEAFCGNPKRELERMCGFLGIPFASSMLNRSTASMHHIGGSPSKFDQSRSEISLDLSFHEQLTKSSLEKMREIVGDVAAEWGY